MTSGTEPADEPTGLPPFEYDRVAIELGLTPAPPGYVLLRWYRNRKGTVVHKRECSRRKPERGLAWFWAERAFADDVELIRGLPAWVRPCHFCLGDAAKQAGCVHVLDEQGECWCNPELRLDADGTYWHHSDPHHPSSVMVETEP